MAATKTGQRIREVRQELGLSLRSLGTRIGVSAVYLSDMERGNRTLPPARLMQIADVLGVTVAELIEVDNL